MTKHSKITAIETPVIGYFDLADLYLSDLNPRQDVDDADIDLLAQSIVACGLIQNLSGLMDENGKVGIVAGGRRLRALQIAVHEEPNLSQVPVKLAVDAHMAETWANVENSVRVDLHPADEIRAFGKMFDKSLGVPRIAKVFGVTEKHVYRRLALVNLPSPVLDALKSGEINMTMAASFTVCDDEKLSLEVLERVRGDSHSAHQMKNMLKPSAVSGSDRKAVFVGAGDYKAAGGIVGGDLFSDQITFDSPDILEEIFQSKLAKVAADLCKEQGWKWAETIESSHIGYWEIEQGGYERFYPVEGALAEDQTKRFEELSGLDDEGDLDKDGETELALMQTTIDGDYTTKQKAHGGIIVNVSHSGEVSISGGLVKREDKKAAIEAGVLAKSNHQSSDKPKSDYSQKLIDDLKAIKLGARQNAMVNKADMMLDLLAFQLSGNTGYRRIFEMRFDHPRNQPDTETGFCLDARLTEPNDVPKDNWNSDLEKTFSEFQAKGKKHRNAEIARHLAALLSGGDEAFSAVLDEASGANIRSVWTPTAENFFKRVNGAYLEALHLTMLDLKADHKDAKAFTKLKKGEKAVFLETIFGDEDTRNALGLDDDQKARIDAWLPDYFG
ncbi:MAG: ParB N-terminal domain-containing protein [Rhodobacteraceae bacterium]|nr:ParB N-terminal domain-containing protein [Paracoccaceae bacterium]